MFTCDIGIVCECTDNYIITLGKINKQYNTYKLYTYLKYYPPCNASVKITNGKSNIQFSNITDIIKLRNKYKIHGGGDVYHNKQLCNKLHKKLYVKRILLYDITCLVPLYRTTKDSLSMIKYNNINYYLVLPVMNPVKRGKLLEKCIEVVSKEENNTFLVFSKVYGNNKDCTYISAKRYLIERNIYKRNILGFSYTDPRNAIIDAIFWIKESYNIFLQNNINIYIPVLSKYMDMILVMIRNLKLERCIPFCYKFFFLC